MQCWPAILNGTNMIAISPTGSGKTLSFALPAIAHILAQPPINFQHNNSLRTSMNKVRPYVLVVAPARELAIQIHAVFKTMKTLSNNNNIKSAILYGGQEKEQQLDNALEKIKLLESRVIMSNDLIKMQNDLIIQKTKTNSLNKKFTEIFTKLDNKYEGKINQLTERVNDLDMTVASIQNDEMFSDDESDNNSETTNEEVVDEEDEEEVVVDEVVVDDESEDDESDDEEKYKEKIEKFQKEGRREFTKIADNTYVNDITGVECKALPKSEILECDDAFKFFNFV